jgi:nicotinate-nucleotide adenylyltransferase
MRIAFFGGSFDPPHLGHLAISRAAREALGLDRVLFAPVGNQPLKPDGAWASFADRAAMVGLAIAEEPAFQLSLLDAPGTAPNYTIDTLASLRESSAPGTKLFLLIGADGLRSLHKWHRAAEIPFVADLIVASRPEEDLSDLPSLLPAGISLNATTHPNRFTLANEQGDRAQLILLPDLHYEISATQIRDQMNDSALNPNTLLSPAVLAYIRDHHLYR